jgi:hypothetical protein
MSYTKSSWLTSFFQRSFESWVALTTRILLGLAEYFLIAIESSKLLVLQTEKQILTNAIVDGLIPSAGKCDCF